jgi:hypothetical protein
MRQSREQRTLEEVRRLFERYRQVGRERRSPGTSAKAPVILPPRRRVPTPRPRP